MMTLSIMQYVVIFLHDLKFGIQIQIGPCFYPHISLKRFINFVDSSIAVFVTYQALGIDPLSRTPTLPQFSLN